MGVSVVVAIVVDSWRQIFTPLFNVKKCLLGWFMGGDQVLLTAWCTIQGKSNNMTKMGEADFSIFELSGLENWGEVLTSPELRLRLSVDREKCL